MCRMKVFKYFFLSRLDQYIIVFPRSNYSHFSRTIHICIFVDEVPCKKQLEIKKYLEVWDFFLQKSNKCSILFDPKQYKKKMGKNETA